MDNNWSSLQMKMAVLEDFSTMFLGWFLSLALSRKADAVITNFQISVFTTFFLKVCSRKDFEHQSVENSEQQQYDQ